MGGGFWQKALLAIALAACIALAFSVRLIMPSLIAPDSFTYVNQISYYPYPFHADEWTHIAASQAILEERKFNFNPYLAEPMQDREKGFHLAMALLFVIPIASPILIYQYLAPLMLAINALFLYLLVRKLTKNDWIGLAAIPFFAAVKSNTNMLGHWYFVPFTFTLFLIFIYFGRISAWAERHKKKDALIAGIIFLIAIFTYPFAAVIMALATAFFILSDLKLVRKKFKTILYAAAALGAISLAFILAYFWSGSLVSTTETFLSELLFTRGWTILEYNYSLIGFHGVIPLLLAFAGGIYFWGKKGARILIIWPLIHFTILLISTTTNHSILIPYQRNLFYFLVSIAPLSGTGLFWAASSVIKHTKKFLKSGAVVAAIILCAFVLASMFYDYYTITPSEFGLHRIVTDEEYDAMLWLRENAKPYQNTVAEPFLALATYPVAKQRTLGIIPAGIEGGKTDDAMAFFQENCTAKKKIIEDNMITFIISRDRLECTYLSQIFKNKEVYIYQTNQVSV